MNHRIPARWRIPEREVTPESAWRDRRRIVRSLQEAGRVGLSRRQLLSMGAGALGASGLAGCGLSVEGFDSHSFDEFRSPYDPWFPVPNNPLYTVPERPLTDALTATRYNNFYEFTTWKSAVWQTVGDFQIEPWTLEVTGLCRNPGLYDIEELFRLFDMEERIYRFRCVETWAMTVPWSGFALRRLIEHMDPLSEASHVVMISANRPDEMPGVESYAGYPWPYHEGLRLDEATNELAMMVAGIYGEALPRQNGAPLRLITPWKYGYKSIKSVIRLEFVDYEPPTFWNTLVPSEYGFLSNVDPDVPHPRWSQANESLIPDGEVVPTLKYNGYEAEVAGLYEG